MVETARMYIIHLVNVEPAEQTVDKLFVPLEFRHQLHYILRVEHSALDGFGSGIHSRYMFICIFRHNLRVCLLLTHDLS